MDPFREAYERYGLWRYLIFLIKVEYLVFYGRLLRILRYLLRH